MERYRRWREKLRELRAEVERMERGNDQLSNAFLEGEGVNGMTFKG